MVRLKRQPGNCATGQSCCQDAECEPAGCHYLNFVGTVINDSVAWTEVVYELVNFPSSGVFWEDYGTEWRKYTITGLDDINGTYTVTRQSNCATSVLTVDVEVSAVEEVYPLHAGDLGNGFNCPDLGALPTINNYLSLTLRLQFYPRDLIYTIEHKISVTLLGTSAPVVPNFGFIQEQFPALGVYTDDNSCALSEISLWNYNPAYSVSCTYAPTTNVWYGIGSTAETIV